MGRMTGKTVVISGAARGQGRAHAVTMSREGANIVAFDVCEPSPWALHPAATLDDLEETRRLVEANDQRCMAVQLDARDLDGLRTLADSAIAEFGRVDTVVVNHGIWTVAPNSWTLEEDVWQESIDVLLSGAWKVTKAFIPKIIDSGRGGSIILTSSVNGLAAQPSGVAYTVAKHGLLGMMKTLAWELGSESIRVNAVMPGGIATPMIEGGTIEKSIQYQPRFFSTDRFLLKGPKDGFENSQGWSTPGPEVVADAVLFLASDESAYITGASLPVDGGYLIF